jgi:hypothetical protein
MGTDIHLYIYGDRSFRSTFMGTGRLGLRGQVNFVLSTGTGQFVFIL